MRLVFPWAPKRQLLWLALCRVQVVPKPGWCLLTEELLFSPSVPGALDFSDCVSQAFFVTCGDGLLACVGTGFDIARTRVPQLGFEKE